MKVATTQLTTVGGSQLADTTLRKKKGQTMSLQIRRKTYRGIEGWLICGRPLGSLKAVSIFTHSRKSAERIRDKVREGKEIGMEDFND